MRFPRLDSADPASAGFEALPVFQAGKVLLSHTPPFGPGNGQHAAATAQGTLIGGVTELSRRQRVNASTSRLAEKFASPARINTTPRSLLNRPTLRAALASQGTRTHTHTNVSQCKSCAPRRNRQAREIECDICICIVLVSTSTRGEHAFGMPV